jgi:hypothetical protein
MDRRAKVSFWTLHPGPLARLARAFRSRFLRQTPRSWQPSEETLQNWEDIRAIPASHLDRVIGVGQAVDASAITIELLAIEVRAIGFVLHWRGMSHRDGILLEPAVSILDDVGTRYRIIGGGGGGSAQAWEGQTFVLPSPPAGARLAITLESFGPFSDRPVPKGVPTDSIPGPWPFVVDLPGG